MTKDEVQLFLAGLKTEIKRSWPTQGEFAQGVTSKVNLCNILRDNSGISKVMIKKLADRAGKPVDEIVAMGKGTVRTRKSDRSPAELRMDVSLLEATPDITSADLLNQMTSYSLQITENVIAHAKSVNDSMRVLVEERERLQKEVENRQLLMDHLAFFVKIVNPDMTIDYYSPHDVDNVFGIQAGDSCKDTGCTLCHEDCVAKRIFVTGKTVRKVVQNNNSWFLLMAYPVVSPKGEILKVIVATQPLDNMLQLIKESGVLDEEIA